MSVVQLLLAIVCISPGLPEARRSNDDSSDVHIEHGSHLNFSWSRDEDAHHGPVGVVPLPMRRIGCFNECYGGGLFDHEWIRLGVGIIVLLLITMFLYSYLSGGKDELVDEASTSGECLPDTDAAQASTSGECLPDTDAAQASTSGDCLPDADAAQARDLKGLLRKTAMKAVVLNRLSGGWFVQAPHHGYDQGDLMIHAEDADEADPKHPQVTSSSSSASNFVQCIIFFVFAFSLIGEAISKKLSQDINAETGKSVYPYEPLFIPLLNSIILMLSGYIFAFSTGGLELLKECFDLHAIAIYTPSSCLFRIGGIFDLLSLQYLPVDLWGFAASVFSLLVAALASSVILKKHVHAAEWMSLLQISLGIGLMSYVRISDRSPSSEHSQFGIGMLMCMLARIFRTLASVLLEKYTQRAFHTSFFIQSSQIHASMAVVACLWLFCFKRPVSLLCGKLDHPIEFAQLFDGWDKRTVVVLLISILHLFLSGLITKHLSTVLKVLSGTFSTCVGFWTMTLVWPSEYPFQWLVGFAWTVLSMSLLNHTVTKRLISSNNALEKQLQASSSIQK